MFDLSGRVALVTGAGQNIGEGIAHALASRGATVAVNDLLPERAEAVAKSVGGIAVPFDVTDLAAVRAGVAAIGRPVDILVNNAGNGGARAVPQADFVDLEPEQWEGTIRVNLDGVLHCCKAVVAGMCERGFGRVITIASVAGTAGTDLGLTHYAAGKGASLAFTRSLALEVARSGVTANSLALGLMTLRNPEHTERLARSIPVGRIGRPDDVGPACVWLASDEAAWVTGQTIGITGGSFTS